MKIASLLCAAAILAPFVEGSCSYQSTGWFQQKWRLSTYKSNSCKNKTGDWTRSGFGVHCINIPNNTRSFIFTVGWGYDPTIGQTCSIFFKTKDNCGGDQVGRSLGRWKKSSLTANGRKMKGAYVQCTKFFKKRDVSEGEDADYYDDGFLRERSFIMGDDDEWYEELPDGTLVKAPEAAEDAEYDDVPLGIEAET